jgi:hypothetical protein
LRLLIEVAQQPPLIMAGGRGPRRKPARRRLTKLGSNVFKFPKGPKS